MTGVIAEREGKRWPSARQACLTTSSPSTIFLTTRLAGC